MCIDIVSRQIPPKGCTYNPKQLFMPPIIVGNGTPRDDRYCTSPDHFSPTGREEEVGWPRETTSRVHCHKTKVTAITVTPKNYTSGSFWHEYSRVMNVARLYNIIGDHCIQRSQSIPGMQGTNEER